MLQTQKSQRGNGGGKDHEAMVVDVEMELMALRRDEEVGAHSEAAVQATAMVEGFYGELKQAYSDEGAFSHETSLSRRNQREFYLNEARRMAAAAASRRHLLHAHPDWLEGSKALGTEDLKARVALQHFATVDLQDLKRARGERLSDDDDFTDQGISLQFLLDAGRSDFVFFGKELSFRKELEAQNVCLEEESLKVEHMLRDFERRLTEAFLSCFDATGATATAPPPELVQALSRTMSQSGMANVERACTGPRVVVSGGEQSLRYELTSRSPKEWEVRSVLRKYDFQQFVIADETCVNEPGKVLVLECSPKSQILRGSTLKFEFASDGNLNADVQDLVDRTEILDPSGRLLTLPGQMVQRPRVRWKDVLTRQASNLAARCMSTRPHRPLISFVSKVATRCSVCRRRAGVSRADSGSLPLTKLRSVCGTEDPDDTMRVPLRRDNSV